MGLYSECKKHLIDKLKEAGVKSKPYTTQKALVKSLESHVSAKSLPETAPKNFTETKRELRRKDGRSSTARSRSP